MQSIRQALPALRAACPQCARMEVRSQPKRLFSSTLRSFDQAGSSTASAGTRSAFGSTQAQAQDAAMRASRQKLYAARAQRSTSILLYSTGSLIIAFGVTYAAVPLYRAFCSATGFAGTPITDPTRFSPDRLYTTPETEAHQRITVHFQSDASETLPWTFKPLQKEVKVLPGETALAFYRAKNEGTEDLIGIATYNMQPEKIAPYFAKVECFCFEEQKIRAGEEVDLPIFFFIDRDVIDDPGMDGVDDVILSYTFFRARRNKQGHAVPDAPANVVMASQGFDKYEHAQAQ